MNQTMRIQRAANVRVLWSVFSLTNGTAGGLLLALIASMGSVTLAEDQFATSELGFDGFYYHYQTDCCQDDPEGHFGTMTSTTRVTPLGCGTTPLDNGLPIEAPLEPVNPIPVDPDPDTDPLQPGPGPAQPGPAPLGAGMTPQADEDKPQHFLPAGPMPKAPERYGRVISDALPIKDVFDGPVHRTAVKVTDANGVTRYFTLVRYKANVTRAGAPNLNPPNNKVVDTYMLLFPRDTANIKISSPEGDYSIVPERVLPESNDLQIDGSLAEDRREYLTLNIPGKAANAKALIINPKEIE